MHGRWPDRRHRKRLVARPARGGVARPLRFRYAPGTWTDGQVRGRLERPLDDNLGATAVDPWFEPPRGYEAVRFGMDDGSRALFCWTDDGEGPEGAAGGPGGYWLGNTETPSELWRTDKYGFTEVPYPVRRWAEREFLAILREEEPWLEAYPHVAWFFLTVFCSKDGADTTRAFFRDHAAGFPDADRDEALSFYEALLKPGILDDYRETMAGKLGTSQSMDLVRMSATMAEFHAAELLTDAGYEITPEIGVTTGHSLDYRADDGGEGHLVEVTRPQPARNRAAATPVSAVRDTAETKTSGQLEAHGGGVTLLVDCSSFPDDDWNAVRGERPAVRHKPAVVYRVRPNGRVEGYRKGSVPIDLSAAIGWIDA